MQSIPFGSVSLSRKHLYAEMKGSPHGPSRIDEIHGQLSASSTSSSFVSVGSMSGDSDFGCSVADKAVESDVFGGSSEAFSTAAARWTKSEVSAGDVLSVMARSAAEAATVSCCSFSETDSGCWLSDCIAIEEEERRTENKDGSG